MGGALSSSSSGFTLMASAGHPIQEQVHETVVSENDGAPSTSSSSSQPYKGRGFRSFYVLELMAGSAGFMAEVCKAGFRGLGVDYKNKHVPKAVAIKLGYTRQAETKGAVASCPCGPSLWHFV